MLSCLSYCLAEAGDSWTGPRHSEVNCGLHLVIQTSSFPEKNKVELRLNKETPSFPGRLLQHDLERNYSSRQANVTELYGLDMKTTTNSLSAFGDSSIQIPSKSRIRQGCHSAGPSVSGDHINLVSSSVSSFHILQRSSEEKILYSDRLTLERQKLTVCPVIDGEEHLRLLNFQHNFITRIQNISNLRRLIFLDLYDNHIEEISGLSTLRSLRVLLLGKNRIKKISNLENLKSLDVLDLHGNQIAKIENVNHLCDLRVLNLARNLLSHVDNLNGLDSLTELNLRHNQITFVRDVDNLPCLQRLFLSFNNISNFESVCCLADSPSLSDITFDGNPIAQEPWYKHTVLQNMLQLRQLDTRRVTEKKRLTINNIARQWDLQHPVTNFATNEDRKNSDSPSLDPCPMDGSTTSAFPEETGSLDSVLTNALQALSVTDTHLVDVDGDTLSLYGSGALESLDRNWSIQTAGMVTTVSFTFIEFDEIVQVLPKLKMKFPNSLHLKFKETNLAMLQQFNALAQLHRVDQLTIDPQGNPVVNFTLWKYYVLFRLSHFNMQKINETEETKEKKKFCKIYIEDLVKEATEINMKKEALQKLWPQMFIELVRDAVLETRNKNSYMKFCLQQIADQK
uniref:Leucine rich repeat containing 49 n=1 Tax=Pipistrellus kuhlii TaxID=59472 RepID=A0A7J8B229_PIPKU|nr:leucine rich repeat containing 49 [Pipistrellus kuhlii]